MPDEPPESEPAFTEDLDLSMGAETFGLIDASTDSHNPQPVPRALLPMPGRVGRFEIRGLLGAGAFGQVFLGFDADLQREVAIKVPRASQLSPEYRERFLREARAAATVQHPNLCPVHEVGTDGGTPYIVMAFIAGSTLEKAIAARGGFFSPRQAAAVVRKLALAVEAAHKKGVIHRDLKPGNVLVDRERGEVFITDFGLARVASPAGAPEKLTREGSVLGTPAYMAPEQATGDLEAIGPGSDVYSLGAILYHLLTGRPPFVGSISDLMMDLLGTAPQPPSSRRGEIDPLLDAICLKALAKKPTDRQASARALADELGAYVRGLGPESDPGQLGVQSYVAVPIVELPSTQAFVGLDDGSTVVQPPARREIRFPWLLVGAALFAALVALGGVIFYFKGPSSTVLVTVDVDTSDPALQFTLDGKAVDAEELKKPIEVKAGEHELVVRKKGEIVRRYVITATPGAEPKFTFVEKQAEPKAAATSKPKADDQDRQRAAVEWMLSIGAEPYVLPPNGESFRVMDKETIPATFVLYGCGFHHLLSVTDGDLKKYLSEIRTFEAVSFEDCPKLGKGLVELLRQFPRLRSVSLFSMPNVTDAELRTLFTMPVLERIALSGNRYDDETLRQLGKAKHMQSLWIANSSISNEACAAIASLTDLHEVTLNEMPANGITPDGVAALARLPILRHFALSYTPVTDSHLTPLATFPKLEILYLIGTAVTDDGAAKLAAIPALKELYLDVTAFGDRGLERLAPARKLKVLSLRQTRVTDAGLKALVGRSEIEGVFLEKTAVSDMGVRHLAELPNLRTASFECLEPKTITDASVPTFAKMTKLTELYLAATDVTPAGANAIKKALPNCRVVYNGQAIEPVN